MLLMLRASEDDKHPDAHACRLKVAIALMYSSSANQLFPFKAVDEYKSYLRGLPRVSKACLLDTKAELAFIVSLEEKDRQSYDIGNRWTFLQSSEGNPDKQLMLYSPAMKLPSKSWRIIRHAASREFTISRGTKKALNWFVHLKYERPERDANVAALLNAFLEEPDLSGRKSQLGYLFLHDILTGGCAVPLRLPASS